MKIGITGASGFIGGRIVALGRQSGHEMVEFSRTPSSNQRRFDLSTPPDVSGLDAIIHLAGESLLGLWTAEKKRRIRESRVEGTRRVVEAMATGNGPKALISSSAIGFYGDSGEDTVDETSPAGSGFLAEVGQQWEEEARRAESSGIRVACIRTGMVLGHGGAMKLIAPLFRLGLGGKLGTGRQWMSPVHVDDVAGIFLWAAESEHLAGPFNAVLPEPVRNVEFTREVARTVHRPAILPAPAFALRLILGELSGLLLDSVRVEPRRTLETGYRFRFPTLSAALQDSLDSAR